MLEMDANLLTYTLSGRIGKVVASNAESCKIESRVWLSSTDLNYARGTQGYCSEGGACNQSIGYIISDAIVRSWLW